MSAGIIDRFRSLPMSRAAVLAGRTFADTIRNVFVCVIMLVVGLLLGFRFHDGLLRGVGHVRLGAALWLCLFVDCRLLGHDHE